MTTSQKEKVSTLRINDEVCCLDGLQKMEPLWSPVVANSGNQSQIGRGRNWRKHAETLAVGCNQLRPGLDGKEPVCHRLPPVAHNPLSVKEGVDA
jgi:hypothetical protein